MKRGRSDRGLTPLAYPVLDHLTPRHLSSPLVIRTGAGSVLDPSDDPSSCGGTSDCVEVAGLGPYTAIRDSQDRRRPPVVLTRTPALGRVLS
ncbi:DUF397 domain-containing protein [Streptomyces marianii]|uniref:DUF397 domain-containing protein n=1 Tax=Streptomyces marianii TaxID=1817406 RepID=UPI00389A21B2